MDPHRYRRLRQPRLRRFDHVAGLPAGPENGIHDAFRPAQLLSTQTRYPREGHPGLYPRDYLTHWLSQWVRDYGIDGFRVDTAKHVELAAWQQLKDQASQALAAWKGANPDKKLDNAPFWMTGESWGHGVMQSDYYRHGFDAMINFDYQEQAAKAVDCLADMDLTWQQMAEKLQSFNVLSYLSSHDTRLFREGASARRSCFCWHRQRANLLRG
jgi:alpha-amylase